MDAYIPHLRGGPNDTLLVLCLLLYRLGYCALWRLASDTMNSLSPIQVIRNMTQQNGITLLYDGIFPKMIHVASHLGLGNSMVCFGQSEDACDGTVEQASPKRK